MNPFSVLVLGAGRQGRAITYALSTYDDVTNIEVSDAYLSYAKVAAAEAQNNKGFATKVNLDKISHTDLVALLKPHEVCVSCADYKYHLKVTEAAIEAKTHMVDLGGSVDVADRQQRLHDKALAAGVTIFKEQGLAPGIVGLLAAYGISELGGKAKNVTMRCGGIPTDPVPPLNYFRIFNTRGLTCEYIYPCHVLRNGKFTKVDPLTEIEHHQIEFNTTYDGRKHGDGSPCPLEAFHTSGGISSLPETFVDQVENMDYKTFRYPGHATVFHGMLSMGAFSEELLCGILSPRVFTEQLMENDPNLDINGEDVVLVRVNVEDDNKKIEFAITDYLDMTLDHSAMMRTTGYPVAVIAHMLGADEIPGRGVIPAESHVSVIKLIEELDKLGVKIIRNDTKLK